MMGKTAMRSQGQVSFVVVGVATLLLSGCVVLGTSTEKGRLISEQQLAQIEQGKSTRDDVTASLGPPTSKEGSVFIYEQSRSSTTLFGGVIACDFEESAERVIVVFDDKGCVREFFRTGRPCERTQ
jgi:outer membrane protein assembly factor BamE (lipoprotein component of BamABCDE complex)